MFALAQALKFLPPARPGHHTTNIFYPGKDECDRVIVNGAPAAICS